MPVTYSAELPDARVTEVNCTDRSCSTQFLISNYSERKYHVLIRASSVLDNTIISHISSSANISKQLMSSTYLIISLKIFE